MTKTFDAIVIGAGQAGPSLAARLSAAGQSVAIIERHLFGGTCVNAGCIPTKTLVASAKVAHQVRRATDFGIRLAGPATIDWARVKQRKDAIVHESRTGVESWLRGTSGCTVIHGHARFTGPQEVQVGDVSLTARQIFINVGGRPRFPIFRVSPQRRTSPALPFSISRQSRSTCSSWEAVTSDWNSRRCSGASGAR